uniref:Ycf1 n=1 Tax=Valeriana fauriei TaxID=105907 RepID=UPI0021ABD30B|nr:Ycf1 [Valeriana fauriei]UUL71471.1 Ycf1 [Valeriana fauriei]
MEGFIMQLGKGFRSDLFFDLLTDLIVLGMRIFSMKIMNSDVMRGLYCGFMTTLTIAPSFFLLLRDHVVEDKIEKKVSAITGFVMGQFILLISIYYVPLRLALGQPHTITILALPCLFVHFFRWNNETKDRFFRWERPITYQKTFVYGRRIQEKKKITYRVTTRKRIRNFRNQCLYLKHLFFPLLNQILFPSSTLVRLVNTNLFRCNNKILFVSSNFGGWLISFCLLMEWVKSVSVWINSDYLIRLNRNMRSKDYIPEKMKKKMHQFTWTVHDVINYPTRSFTLFLYVICLLYLGKMPPSLIFTRKTKSLEIRRISEEIRILEKGLEEEEEETEDLNLEEKDKSTDKRIYRSTDESTDESTDKRIYRSTDESTDKRIYRSTDESTDKRIYRSTDESTDESTDKSTDESTDENADENVDEKTREEKVYEKRLAKDEPKGFSVYLLSDEVEKEKRKNGFFFWFDFVEKLPVLLLFNCQEWNRPLRYIKSTIGGSILKKEWMTQNFFETCKNDGKQRIYFSYPPSLFIFGEMIKKKLEQEEKQQNEKINRKLKPTKPAPYQNTFYRRKKKREQKIFIHRICALNKGLLFVDILEKKNGLQIDSDDLGEVVKKGSKSLLTHEPFYNETTQEKKKKVLQQLDPLISGPLRIKPTGNYLGQKKNTDTSLSELKRLGINSIYDFLNSTGNFLFADNNIDLINKYINQATQKKKKKVPEWTTQLITDVENDFGLKRKLEDAHMRSRPYKPIVLINYFRDSNKERKGGVRILTHLWDPDFRRNIIWDTRRIEKRKTIERLFLPRPRSPLFWGKTQSKLEAIFDQISFKLSQLFLKLLQIRNFHIFDKKKRKNDKEIKKIRKSNGKKEINKKRKGEDTRLETEEAWDSFTYGPQIRSCLLIIQSSFRQYILFPLLIIAKNTVHFLLYRVSDWHEDFEEWKKEKHLICRNSGTELRDDQIVAVFYEEGFSIIIMNPFSLKPWCKSKLQDSGRNTTKKKKKRKKLESDQIEGRQNKKKFYYLTVLGLESKHVFGSSRTGSCSSFPLIAFLKPLLKKLKQKIKKTQKKVLLVLKKGKKNLSEENSTTLGKLKNLSKSSKTKEESFTQIGFIDLEKNSKTDLQIKNLSDRTIKIRNKTKAVEKGKLKKIAELKSPLDSNVELESQLSPNRWKILKRRTVRLIKKLRYFKKIFISKKYIDIFLPIINITAINKKHFIQLIIRKYILNNEKNQSQNEITEKDIHFLSISTIKKSKPIKKNSHIFYDLSCLSQGYVFFKLSQLEVINLSKLRSVLEYQGTSFFLKTTIKDSFRILNSQLTDKKLRNYDQWKNWLRGHFQYNSPIEWSRLIPQKWRTQVNRRWTAENKDFQKWGLNEKDLLFSFDYTNKTSYQVDSHDAKLRKCYRFSRLLNACLNSETKEESSIYGVPLEESLNKNNILSKELDSNMKNSRGHFLFRDINPETRLKKLDRKYFHFSKLYVNDNESDPSNSKEEIYFEWLNIDKDKEKVKKVLKKILLSSSLWLFSEVAFLLKEYHFTLRKNFCFSTVSVSLEREPDNRSEDETEFERLQRVILDQPIQTKKPKIDETHKLNIDLVQEQFFVSQKLWSNRDVEEKLYDRLLPFSYLATENSKKKKKFKVIITCLKRRKLKPESLAFSPEPWRVDKRDRVKMVLQPIREVRKMSEREAHIKFLINLLPYKRPTGTQNYYDFPVPENILSSRGSRKLKILTSLKFKTSKIVDRNQVFCKQTKITNRGPFFSEGKHRSRDQNELIKLKSFLWPNYRLEDLACINRYWFDTNNGSRLSMLRIYMYPRFKFNIGMYLRLKLNMYP